MRFCRMTERVGRPRFPMVQHPTQAFLKISFPYSNDTIIKSCFPFSIGASMKLFVLSKENIGLSRKEAERLHSEEGTLVENLLFLDAEWKPGLAFTRSIHEVLFESDECLEEDSEAFPWHEHVEVPFAVRSKDVDEKRYAGHVWRALEKNGKQPSVDLKQPKTTITLFSVNGKVWVTRLLWENQDHFFDRRAHLRPRNHPTSLNPKLARAMVNLAGYCESILDPFCGSGGILIEGALVGRAMTGIDIDDEQILRAEENLAHYDVSATLTVGDAMKCDELGAFDAVVTDLPLGKNAKLDDAKTTFTGFFAAAAKVTDTAVVSIDAEFDLEECFGGRWKTLATFDWYLQKEMVKRVFLIRKL